MSKRIQRAKSQRRWAIRRNFREGRPPVVRYETVTVPQPLIGLRSIIIPRGDPVHVVIQGLDANGNEVVDRFDLVPIFAATLEEAWWVKLGIPHRLEAPTITRLVFEEPAAA